MNNKSILSRREDRRPRTDGRHRGIASVVGLPSSVLRSTLTALARPLTSPPWRARDSHFAGQAAAAQIRPGEEDRRRHPQARRRHVRDHVRRARHRARRHPGRHPQARDHDGFVEEGGDREDPQVFINPEILWSSEETATYEEGCLSIPEFYGDVERPAQVKVKYLDLEGKPQEIEADGLLATCLQHEIDHTNGVLFIDHLSKLKRDRVIKKFTKAAKRAAE